MGQGSGGNVIAALASFFIPGLGQLAQGRLVAAVLFFISCSVLYALSAIFIIPIIIALPVHIWCIVNAALFSPRK